MLYKFQYVLNNVKDLGIIYKPQCLKLKLSEK
jgi:hypothetical protein